MSIELSSLIQQNKNENESVFDTSTCSVKSTARDSNYYKKESEKLIDFIRKYFKKNSDYPPSNIKFYKIGRVKIIFYQANWKRSFWES